VSDYAKSTCQLNLGRRVGLCWPQLRRWLKSTGIGEHPRGARLPPFSCAEPSAAPSRGCSHEYIVHGSRGMWYVYVVCGSEVVSTCPR
jgi:hypothetical protein